MATLVLLVPLERFLVVVAAVFAAAAAVVLLPPPLLLQPTTAPHGTVARYHGAAPYGDRGTLQQR